MTRPIQEIAAKLGLSDDDLHLYGRDKAKIDPSVRARPRTRSGDPKLILVSAITPTPAGEGKTTTTIGLGQAMDRQGRSVCLALREPSLGPCFGIKGGGTGGGQSRLQPSQQINLHFTGDLHAITAAHNLLSAVIDNHLHFDREPRIDPRRVAWPRVLDVNDRSLRGATIGLGGPAGGVPRETRFDITAASEVMAMLCLAEDLDDLRARLDRTIVARARDGKAITAGDLDVTGAMLVLLKDALNPNLVQSTEGTPAVVHGGPFANIAHGCNSVIATRTAMHLADWVITEAGFGFDLGGEKFFDIKCAGAGLDTAAVVLVATARALKMHGGASLKDLKRPDPAAVERGLGNLEKQLENVRAFQQLPVVAINRFYADTDDEIAVIQRRCAELGVPVALSDHFMRGGEGALDLAGLVAEVASQPSPPVRPVYDRADPIPKKIEAVARTIYGADGIRLSPTAATKARALQRAGWGELPICVAKTHRSLSDDPKRLGRPSGFELRVEDLLLNAGAGFIVVITGDIVRMPGLPKVPQAAGVDLVDGAIVGID